MNQATIRGVVAAELAASQTGTGEDRIDRFAAHCAVVDCRVKVIDEEDGTVLEEIVGVGEVVGGERAELPDGIGYLQCLTRRPPQGHRTTRPTGRGCGASVFSWDGGAGAFLFSCPVTKSVSGCYRSRNTKCHGRRGP